MHTNGGARRILSLVTNPLFCDRDRMHVACMQIFENVINRLRGLA